MTGQRVLGTDAARLAAQEMRQILGGSLGAHMQSLIATGRTLTNPVVWDGPQAATFRQAQWPAVDRSLLAMQHRLPAMQASVESVLQDIMHAGSTGTLAVASDASTALGSLAALPALFQDWRIKINPKAAEYALAAFSAGRKGSGVMGAANEGAFIKLLTERGSTAFDLNVFRKNSFPFLDAASSEGFFSAKAYSGPGALGKYATDLRDLVTGQFEGAPGKLRQAVSLLTNTANRARLIAADAWPHGLAQNASAADVRAFILEHAKLVVPDDQIAALSALIRQRALDLPGNFGLPRMPTAADIDELLARIVPSGIVSRDVDRITNYFKLVNRIAFTPALKNVPAFLTRVAESPIGKVMKVGGSAFALAGDAYTAFDPSPDALLGPGVERGAAILNGLAVGASLAGPLLAANAATDWIPGVGEVTMGVTAAYFIGDLAWQNRQWIADTGSHLLQGAGNVASSAFSMVKGWL